jgi:hypothetical protein
MTSRTDTIEFRWVWTEAFASPQTWVAIFAASEAEEPEAAAESSDEEWVTEAINDYYND